MSEELENKQLEFGNCNEQDSFIYEYGINRGFKPSYKKITNAWFMSVEAKMLYQVLSEYWFNESTDICYPSQERLAKQMRVSRKTLGGYITLKNHI